MLTWYVVLVIVGIGRPFLYAFSSYGQEGVDKALSILRVCSSCCCDRLTRREADMNAFIGRIRDEFAASRSKEYQGGSAGNGGCVEYPYTYDTCS